MTELSSRNRSHLGRAVTVDSEITEDCRRKPQTVKENKTNDFTCFICHGVGHKKRDCPSLKQSGMHKTAAMQLITHDHPQ